MNKSKLLRVIAIVLLIFLGVNAIAGGLLLIIDPSGQKLNFSFELLQKSPFNSYLIPGLILFIFLGLLSFATAILTILEIKDYHWFIIFQGAILLGWLSIEILINYDFFTPILHYPLYFVGLILLITGFLIRKNQFSKTTDWKKKII